MPAMDKLNIVVICIDTFRADIVGPDKKLSNVATAALAALTLEYDSLSSRMNRRTRATQVRRRVGRRRR